MTVGITEVTDFGTDVSVGDDLTRVWNLASGMDNLALAVYRRITTPEGALDEIDGDDEPYECIDIRAYVNARLSEVKLAQLRGRLAAVIENEERITSVTPEVAFDFASDTLTIKIDGETDDGPFELVFAASGATVDLLSVNGQTPTTAAASTTTPQVIAIVGPKGEPGATGSAGSSGSASVTLDFGIDGDQGYKFATSGAEEVLFQRAVRFGDLPGSLTVAIIGEIASTLGTGTFKVRIGGSSLTADGTVALTMTTGSASFAAVTASGAFANPTGNLFVKVTGQSSAGGQEAWMRPPVVTIR